MGDKGKKITANANNRENKGVTHSFFTIQVLTSLSFYIINII